MKERERKGKKRIEKMLKINIEKKSMLKVSTKKKKKKEKKA